MSCHPRLSSWQQEVSTAFAHLSKAQAFGLALWSAGIAFHKRGGSRSDLDVATCFGPLLRWIVSCFVGRGKRLALALAAPAWGSDGPCWP